MRIQQLCGTMTTKINYYLYLNDPKFWRLLTSDKPTFAPFIQLRQNMVFQIVHKSIHPHLYELRIK